MIAKRYYVFSRKKSITSKTIELGAGVYASVVVFLLATSNIFNDVVIDAYEISFIPIVFKVVFILIAVATVIGSIVDYTKIFINVEHLNKLDNMAKQKDSE